MDKTIVAYYRVSTQAQGLHGLGMDAQRLAVAQFAKSGGLSVIATYEEVETARRDHLRNRPQLVRAIAHARRSRSLLVIARLDRLSRNVLMTSQLLASGVDFVACDNPHANRMTIQILAVMAENESRMISVRVKAAYAAARERGEPTRLRHTFNREALLRASKASAAARRDKARRIYADLVPDVKALLASGLSTSQIVVRLNDAGHTNSEGNPLNWQTLHRLMLQNRLSPNPRRYENHLNAVIRQLGVTKSAKLRHEKAIRIYSLALADIKPLFDQGLSINRIWKELRTEAVPGAPKRVYSYHLVYEVLRTSGLIRPGIGPHRLTFAEQIIGRAAGVARKHELALAHASTFMPLIDGMLSQGRSVGEVVAALNAYGYTPRRQKRWTQAILSALLYRRNRNARVAAPLAPSQLEAR